MVDTQNKIITERYIIKFMLWVSTKWDNIQHVVPYPGSVACQGKIITDIYNIKLCFGCLPNTVRTSTKIW